MTAYRGLTSGTLIPPGAKARLTLKVTATGSLLAGVNPFQDTRDYLKSGYDVLAESLPATRAGFVVSTFNAGEGSAMAVDIRRPADGPGMAAGAVVDAVEGLVAPRLEVAVVEMPDAGESAAEAETARQETAQEVALQPTAPEAAVGSVLSSLKSVGVGYAIVVILVLLLVAMYFLRRAV